MAVDLQVWPYRGQRKNNLLSFYFRQEDYYLHRPVGGPLDDDVDKTLAPLGGICKWDAIYVLVFALRTRFSLKGEFFHRSGTIKRCRFLRSAIRSSYRQARKCVASQNIVLPIMSRRLHKITRNPCPTIDQWWRIVPVWIWFSVNFQKDMFCNNRSAEIFLSIVIVILKIQTLFSSATTFNLP